jgi:hypothetical protein
MGASQRYGLVATAVTGGADFGRITTKTKNIRFFGGLTKIGPGGAFQDNGMTQNAKLDIFPKMHTVSVPFIALFLKTLNKKRRRGKMKKLVVLIFVALFLTGCGQSGFFQHDTMYKNWAHTKFSWYGHNQPTAEDAQKATEQQWWGIEVPYVPGQ